MAVCDDDDICTQDICHPQSGCVFKAVDGPCDSKSITWTVLVYMAADNNLEDSAMLDMDEMLKIPAVDHLNVVVQVDRTAGFSEFGLGSLDNWETTKRLYFKGDKVTELQDLGETNTGDPEVLSDFIAWGVKSYPADRYVAILWNHGNAWTGYGGDSTSPDHDKLNFGEIVSGLSDGLKKAGLKSFDLLGFDACLMADYAIIQALQSFGRYMLVSEDFEPGNGWDYQQLKVLNQKPDET